MGIEHLLAFSAHTRGLCGILTSGVAMIKIISGGQTGADQGGLAAAVQLDLRTGGWIPKGYRTQDGPAPWLARLGLQEHSAHNYPPRTRLNVAESDGTLWFGNEGSPGGRLTIGTARKLKKPIYVVAWRSGLPLPSPDGFARWLEINEIDVLNVAGNRESSQPGIRDATRDFIVQAYRDIRW